MATQTVQTVSDYSIIDHGIEHAQYFQGCGTAFSSFKHVVTGCGDNFAEAIEDALDSMALGGEHGECNGVNLVAFERAMLADEGLIRWPTTPSASGVFMEANPAAEGEDVDFDECELYYYVSIRYNVGAVLEG